MEIFKSSDDLYFLRVDRGEEVLSALRDFASRERVRAAAVSGIGGVGPVRLAYLDDAEKRYRPRDFEGCYELVAFLANLGVRDGEPFVHAHAVISGSDFACHAGHVESMTVRITGEFSIRIGGGTIERVDAPELGILRQEFRGER